MSSYPRILPAGDCSLIVEFGNEISDDINAMISGFVSALRGANIKGVGEAVPTFRSVLINYDPLYVGYDELNNRLHSLLSGLKAAEHRAKRVIEIPVCYGGEYGPDLKFVAEHAGISEQEVIDIHTSRDYLIYMLGFQPGFPYLGGLEPKIFTPRLSEPRVQIPAGSVGIGGEQTGLYPVASPAGWQIIGNTPVRAYNPTKEKAIPYEAGDYIHFYAVTEEEYEQLKALDKKNAFEFKVRV